MNRLVFILKTFRLLREHKPGKLALIFAITLFNGITSGFSIVLLIPLLQLLDVGSSGPAEGPALFFKNMADKTGIDLTIETILLIYLVLLTLTPLLQYWKSLVDAGYQQTFIYRLRRRLFRKIILADWSLLNHKSKTNHLQVLTKEVPGVAGYYYFYLHMVMSLLMTAAYLAWAVLISPGFTLIIAGVGVLLFIFLRRFLFKAFHLGEGVINSYTRLMKYIDDFWQTVKIAKVHSSEEFYYEKFDEANTSLLNLEYKIRKNSSLPQLIYRIAGIVVLVFVVYAGSRGSHIPLTSLFILILLFSRIFPQFVGINSNINNIITMIPSVRMVIQLDEELQEKSFEVASADKSFSLDTEIKLHNITFSYPGGEMLFDNFSAAIPANKITGIVGESGRGKTTLIDIIAGLQTPDEGTISIDGKIPDDKLLTTWKSKIGYLPQDSFFIDGTMRENLLWDSRQDVTDSKILDVLEKVNASYLVKRFKKGLDEHIVNYQFNFSGGECQRLALARVLLRDPGLLLLDEATSSLDHENERQVMDVIVKLKKQVTIIFVTHRASLIPYFDKIISLDGQASENYGN
jgi:ATP-binding cassette, subfamily C, bacterial